MKLALMRTAPGREDQKLPAEDTLMKVSRLRNHKLTTPQVRAHINASQSLGSRHILTSAVQRRLCESGLYGWIAPKKPWLRKNNRKRRAWANKHKKWTLDQWKSVLVFHPPCLCETQKKWADACVVPTMKHGWGGVMVWGCFADDIVADLFQIQGTLNQHGYHSVL